MEHFYISSRKLSEKLSERYNIDVGRNKMLKALRDSGILNQSNLPTHMVRTTWPTLIKVEHRVLGGGSVPTYTAHYNEKMLAVIWRYIKEYFMVRDEGINLDSIDDVLERQDKEEKYEKAQNKGFNPKPGIGYKPNPNYRQRGEPEIDYMEVLFGDEPDFKTDPGKYYGNNI